MEAYGVEHTEHSPMCLNEDIVPIMCEFESHLAHLSESESEMSDSTICEIECFIFEGMRDTPSELREVVDRSCEAISISNNLPSTSSVFSHCVQGCMEQEAPSLDMEPHLEKMYMEDEDDATPWIHQDFGHMEAPTTTTPTSHERYYKGINMGVDDESVPLVDLHNCDDLHAMDDTFDVTYESFLFPCDALPLHNVDHVELLDCDDIDIDMPCYSRFIFPPIIESNMLTNCSFKCFDCNDDKLNANEISPPIACKMMNNCSLKCFACNDTYHMVDNEMAPIAFSIFGDSKLPHFGFCNDMHIHHAHNMNLIDTNGDAQQRRCIMMDDVFIYHAHTLFSLSHMCVGPNVYVSTSIEHELTK